MLPPFHIYFPPAYSGDLKISNEYPPGTDHKLSSAVPLLVRCELGDFLTQSVNGDGYWIELWSFLVKKDGYLDISITEPSIAVVLFLEGNLEGHLLNNGRVRSPEKTYNIFYFPVGTQRVNMRKGIHSLMFFIPPQYYLDDLAASYPAMKKIVGMLLNRKKEGHFVANLSLPEFVRFVIRQWQSPAKKRIALDIAYRKGMYDILLLFNKQLNNRKAGYESGINAEENAQLARKFIIENLGNHDLGGPVQLALHFHVTAKTLTKQFILLTGKTIPRFISDERMEWARRLIEENKLFVFEIAFLTGFNDTSNFIRKFKRKFGYPPHSLRDAAKKQTD